jgi:hypothetical protein
MSARLLPPLLLALAACSSQESAGTRAASVPAATQSAPASRPERLVKVATTLVRPDPAKSLVVQSIDIRLTPGKERPEAVKQAPELPGATWITGQVLSHPIRLAVADAPDGSGQATLLADLDGDGDLTRAEERFTVRFIRRGPMMLYLTDVVFKFAEVEVKPLLQRSIRGEFDAVAMVACHREGPVTIDGQQLLLLLIDQDLDGRYAGAADFWLLESPKTIFRPRLKGKGPSNASMVECNEPVWIGPTTTAWIRGIDNKGVVTLAVGPESAPIGEYLRRRHARVTREAAAMLVTDSRGFLAESKLDPDRKKIQEPLPWLHAIDLKLPLERARAEGKPLLVYLDGDGVAACRFADHYLMADQEVAARLEAFLLVRWNVDLEQNRWSQQFSPPGFPRWVVVASDGKVARVITGFQLPSLLLAELDKGFLDAGGKAPR